MAKIFATKALSMVLCFVMLFMGAPVTTWAGGSMPYFTLTEHGGVDTAVTGNASTPCKVRVNETVYVYGFAETDQVTLSAPPGANVTIDQTAKTFKFTAAADSVQLSAAVDGGSTYTLEVQVYQPVVTSVEIVKAADETATENIFLDALMLPRSKPGSFKFDAVVKDQHGREMSGESVTWSVAEDAATPFGATVTDTGEFAFTKVGYGTISATWTDAADASNTVGAGVFVSVASAIYDVRLCGSHGNYLWPTIFGPVLVAPGFSLGAAVLWLPDGRDCLADAAVDWIVTDGVTGQPVTTGYEVRGSVLTLLAPGVYSVQAVSALDPRKASLRLRFRVFQSTTDVFFVPLRGASLDGDTLTLDAFGNGVLSVSSPLKGLSVSAELSGAGRLRTSSGGDFLSISGAQSGDTLTVTAAADGFELVSRQFVLMRRGSSWGDPTDRPADRKVQYVDAAGKASIELASENLANGILWLREESGGTSAWYGIDLSTGAFELDKGSRFYVQWLHKDDAEYATYYAQLDDEQKSQMENGWIFLIGVEDASGNKVQPESPVKTYVQIGDDWDLDDLKAYYIAAEEDQSIDVEGILGFAYPEGEDEFGMMTLSHFSPYLIMDELSDAEKIALGKGKNNKTGDQAVQVAVAGFGSILVLALGIMLRLITSKKKFED